MKHPLTVGLKNLTLKVRKLKFTNLNLKLTLLFAWS